MTENRVDMVDRPSLSFTKRYVQDFFLCSINVTHSFKLISFVTIHVYIFVYGKECQPCITNIWDHIWQDLILLFCLLKILHPAIRKYISTERDLLEFNHSLYWYCRPRPQRRSHWRWNVQAANLGNSCPSRGVSTLSWEEIRRRR